MYCAIEFGNELAARLLVHYGVDPFAHEAYAYDVKDNGAVSPFHAAARQLLFESLEQTLPPKWRPGLEWRQLQPCIVPRQACIHPIL